MAQINIGLLHIFIKHTSASLTINENADPDVLVDLDRVLDTLAAEEFPYRHPEEGTDDMPAHVKASLLGCSLTDSDPRGAARLGTWQGICLCEHRRRAGGRRIVLTMQGENKMMKDECGRMNIANTFAPYLHVCIDLLNSNHTSARWWSAASAEAPTNRELR